MLGVAATFLFFVGCAWQPNARIRTSATDAALVIEFLVRNSDPTIRLPLPKGFTYDFVVDWNDGTESYIDSHDDPDTLHRYERVKSYRVSITGQVGSWSFWKVPHSKDRIVAVEDLGDVGWHSLAGAFYDCNLLESTAGGDTSAVTDMSYMYHRSPLVVPDTSAFDTSSVTTMRAMFDRAASADPDVRVWDTSKVRDMSGMFAKTSEARPQTDRWDTSKVVLMSDMFRAALVANPTVTRWNTSDVKDMSSMFAGAVVADPHVNDWDTGSVVSMYGMFKNATSARPDMSRWDFAEVKFMDDMFAGVVLPTSTYSQMLTRAALTARQQEVVLHAGEKTRYHPEVVDSRELLVETMRWEITDGGLDTSAQEFSTRWEVRGSDLTVKLPLVCADGRGGQYDYNFKVNWGDGVESQVVRCDDNLRTHTYSQEGVYTVTITGLLEAWSFKEEPHSRAKLTDVWNLGSVGWKSLRGAFAGCSNLNTVAGGDTALVTDMSYMFHDSPQVDVEVGEWDTRRVTDMGHMFKDATVARPEVSNWDVSSVLNMTQMFKNATRAEPDMSGWNFAQVGNMDEMFVGVKLPTTNYDKMLLCLCATSQRKDTEINLHGGQSKYSLRAYSAHDLPCSADSMCVDADGSAITTAEAARDQLDKNENGNWVIDDGGLERIPAPFVTRWYLPRGGQITLPLLRRAGLSYALEVEWCDGTRESISGDEWDVAAATHTCPPPASSDLEDLPTVIISGDIGTGRWSCRDFAVENRCDKLYAVDDLGDLGWKNLSGAFAFAESLVVFAGGNTSQVTDMSFMFFRSERVRPEVSNFDVSKVENMWGMFQGALSADPDVSMWNTSRVKDMGWMFAQTRLANPDVSDWRTSLVTSTQRMFSQAELADPDLSNWDMQQVTDISYMFYQARQATPDVAQWNTARVEDMAGVFRRADKADPDVGSWDTSRVTNMHHMFADTRSATPDVSRWDVGRVTNMRGMFRNAVSARPDVSDWNVASVEDMSFMFAGATKVANSLNVAQWDFRAVAKMGSMFKSIALRSDIYSKMLMRIEETTTKKNVTLHAGGSRYNSQAAAVRQRLIDDRGWKITDGGLEQD